MEPTSLTHSIEIPCSDEILDEDLAMNKKRKICEEFLSSRFHDAPECKRPKKSVRFATNATTGEINPFILEYTRAPSELRDQLWWSSEEFNDRYEQDLETMALVQDCYRTALRLAYGSIQRASCYNVNLSFQAVMVCSNARGMESQVMPEIANYVKGHCQAVLGVQEMARAANKDFCWNESNMKVFRLLSLKYSRRSQLVAAKMGEFDRQILLM
ncbi:hypothetical protein ACA910_004281 [Epithemia clementina (nom. ined.)]